MSFLMSQPPAPTGDVSRGESDWSRWTHRALFTLESGCCWHTPSSFLSSLPGDSESSIRGPFRRCRVSVQPMRSLSLHVNPPTRFADACLSSRSLQQSSVECAPQSPQVVQYSPLGCSLAGRGKRNKGQVAGIEKKQASDDQTPGSQSRIQCFAFCASSRHGALHICNGRRRQAHPGSG